MADTVGIKGLRVETHIGVTEQERAQPQTVVIDIDIHADLSRAGETDDVADTVDYAAVAEAVAKLVGASECKLLEHLAAKVVGVISTFSGVNGVTVVVGKETAPMPVEVDGVSVRVERP